MPDQFFVRAMHSNSGFFLSDEFVAEARKVNAEDLTKYLMSDLDKENDENPNPVLMLYYLFTDFQHEFSRLMMMKNTKKKSDSD